MTSYCHIRSRCDLSYRFRKIKVRLIISIIMLDVTNWITRNNLRFAYILLYPKDRKCVIGNDSATRKRFMKFLINITMYSLTQRKYLNNIKLTPWQTYRTLLPNCFSSSHLFMVFFPNWISKICPFSRTIRNFSHWIAFLCLIIF